MIDLEAAKLAVGDKVVISGNVETFGNDAFRDTDPVEANVKECLKKAYDSPKGYMLALGCALADPYPAGEYPRPRGGGKELGRYPYDTAVFG